MIDSSQRWTVGRPTSPLSPALQCLPSAVLPASCDAFCNCAPSVLRQAKNGEALPAGRAQRGGQPGAKASSTADEREEAEQKAVQAVQCSLLKILSKTLNTLQHFTPDCCQILLDQVHTHSHTHSHSTRDWCSHRPQAQKKTTF